MAWTLPTALFFSCIAAALLTMTLLELRWPTRPRQGFLPIVTTRGDRFFISLLSAAFIHLLWMGLSAANLPAASALSVVWAVVLMRWG